MQKYKIILKLGNFELNTSIQIRKCIFTHMKLACYLHIKQKTKTKLSRT